MTRNPYTPPKANVAGGALEQTAEPSEWQRAKKVFGTLWIALTVLPVLNAIVEPPPAPDPFVLALNCCVALALAGAIGRDMWLLRVRRNPIAVDVAMYTVILGGLAFLIIVKETGIYDWNDLHLDVPVFLLMGAVAGTAWFTERRKKVRIYMGPRQLIFREEAFQA